MHTDVLECWHIAEVEQCSCIILHCWENHELLFPSVDILLNPKLFLGFILLLLSNYVIVSSYSPSSLLLLQVLPCSTSLSLFLLLTFISSFLYPLSSCPVALVAGSSYVVLSIALPPQRVDRPNRPCYLYFSLWH
jgi:hypothetical protein